MKRLTRIIFVNWYLFESKQFDLCGDVLVTGSNGSGKTSLLDAIQVVALGGHGHHLQLNANAAAKGERSIKGYCLGQLSTHEEGNDTLSVAREDSVTHIGLVFVDDETGEATTIGITMSAKKSQPKHEVQGLYILENMQLSIDDYIQETDLGDVPLSWQDFKNNISRRSDQKGITPYIFGKQPEKYMEQLCITLSPDNRRLDPKKFIQSFRKAVNLKDIENVSDFVKFHVLEDHPLNIKRLDDTVTLYKEMLESAQAIKKQLQQMGSINTLFTNWDRCTHDSINYQWVEKEYQYMHADSLRAKMEEDQNILTENIATANQKKISHETRLVLVIQEKEELKTQIDSDDKKSQVKALKAEIESINQALTPTRNAIKGNFAKLESIANLSRFEDTPNYIQSIADQVISLLPGSPIETEIWPQDPSSVDKGIPLLQASMKEAVNLASKENDRLGYEYTIQKNDFKSNRERLNKLQDGGSNVSSNTATLQRELLTKGVDAVPLCDLVEVTDPAWQSAIESYLGNNVEALFVPTKDAERAVGIFRKLNRSKHLYGATVINSLKVETWAISVKNGSCASHIKTDNLIVKAFLTRILNRVICVNTERELLQEDIAITSDGMLHKNGSVKSLRIRTEFILGKKARENAIANLKEKISIDGGILEITKQRKAIFEQLQPLLSVADNKITNWKSITTLKLKLKEQELDIDKKEKQRDRIDLGHLQEIIDAHQVQVDFETKLKDDLKSLDGNINQYKIDAGVLEKDLERKLQEADGYAQQREKIEMLDYFDMDKANDRALKLADEFDTDEVIIKQAQKHHQRNKERANDHQIKANRDLDSYRRKFSIEHPTEEPSTKDAWAWVRSTIEYLKSTELAQYEKSAQKALIEAETAFRSDVACKLRENIKQMQQLIKELNVNLESRPFSGQETYQFKYSVNKEYKDILNFIETTSQDAQQNVGGLFDTDQNVADQLIELIKTDEDMIADYRNYYSYDIVIKNKTTGASSKLSTRIKTASGGENRTPYYVTIGASMASAYRISKQYKNNGIAIIPLDEAFEKMDGTNFYQAASYLKDVGLQMFLAAPDDSEMKLSPLVDTVIFLTREGNYLSSSVKYLKDAATELLLSDNMAIHPELIEEANV